MARIAILTPAFIPADAVSNDVSGMFHALKRAGHEVTVFANEWAIDGIGVEPAYETKNFITGSGDILIYHYSMGWNFGLNMLREVNCQRVVKYHNITPPEYFTGVSTNYEDICRIGREQTSLIAGMDCDLYLSDSEYNMWEMALGGAPKSRSLVVHPFHHIDGLNLIGPDMDILRAYRGTTTNILMVGRVAPNKGHATLIEAFANYHHNYNKDSRLLVVGKEPEFLESYSHSLRELVDSLNVKDAVVFTGGVSDDRLKAYYLVADVFMMTSHHEGFCVPLVEAMALKVPILACASSAITGTVGKAGIVWKERNPHLLAESIDFLVKDESVAVALGLMGWRRYEKLFTNERIESSFLQALSQLL